MKLVKVKQSFYDLIMENHVDEEIMFNEFGRPCVLIVDLEYKDALRKFVIPLRSNISLKHQENNTFHYRQIEIPEMGTIMVSIT